MQINKVPSLERAKGYGLVQGCLDWLVALQSRRGRCQSPDAPWRSHWFIVSPKGLCFKNKVPPTPPPREGHSCAASSGPSREGLALQMAGERRGEGGEPVWHPWDQAGDLLPTHLPKFWEAVEAAGKPGEGQEAQAGWAAQES